MTLLPGTRLGPYTILALVGRGGMGEVYRATDTRLDRSVAIKVIGSGLSNLPDVRQRFDAEARLNAQLDHPRICPVYDVGHDSGIDYVVMEFLEGETLASRLLRGPIPIADVVGFAVEIASALAYAHRRGIVHRDVKPGNIFLTPAGIRIVDFGLARLRQLELTPSPDVASQNTRPLVDADQSSVHGTAEYVSPERLHGHGGDHREDVFAFGAVVYEMATGRRAFEGTSTAAVIAAIMSGDPPPMAEDRVPATLQWVVRRCLEKNPDLRWQSMQDIEMVLKWTARGSAEHRPQHRPATISHRTLLLVTIGSVLLAGAALVLLARRWPAARDIPPTPVLFTVLPTPAEGFTPTESSVKSPQIAVSPDGRLLAFVATAAGGDSQIWVRPINAAAATPLAGTLDATYPFWSPTSRSLAFFSHDQLKRVDLDGGPALVLARARAGNGGAWGSDGTILFSPEPNSGLHSLRPDGTVHQETVPSAERHESSHRWPYFLPDGRHFIYLAKADDESPSAIRLGSLGSRRDVAVARADFGAICVPPNHLLYVSEHALLAATLDVENGRLVDNPVTVVDRVATSSNFYGAFSASRTGVLAYATPVPPRDLIWVGRDGRPLGVAAGAGDYVDFRLSPDNRYLAAAEVGRDSERSDLRLIDLVRGDNPRLTTSPATDASPVWSPDGTRLAFRSNRESRHDLYVRPAAAGGSDAVLLKTPASKYPTDWSPDGTFVVYHSFDQRSRYDIWAAPVRAEGATRPLVRTDFDDIQGQVSPSGRWLAYASNESSRFEVYVQPLLADGRKWQVSVDGGSDPRWRADEKELFFLGRDGRVISVGLTGGTSFRAAIPRPLFQLQDVAPVKPPYLSAYDAQRDGQRFVVPRTPESLEQHPFTVIVNWQIPRRPVNTPAQER